jgi:CDP-glucose 4,6-dehydratase
VCDSVKIPTALASATLIDPRFWSDRHVLLTGHTGFKGAWLSLWLQSLGARVTGLAPAMPPTTPSLYALAGVAPHMAGELQIDVRDALAVREAVRTVRPEVVLHLAAQPMVRYSLRDPALTFEVNVLGTVAVLEAVRLAGESVRAVVVVTSDKCYANPPGTVRRFVEDDPLGGRDPYSSSKACAELVTAAYRDSFFSGPGPRVASARAGNVIGGGDFGADRLVPDILRAYDAGRPVRVRNPDAIRPWQHVLSPLCGYLALAQALCGSEVDPAGGPDSAAGSAEGHSAEGGTRARANEADYYYDYYARAWNFGPRPQDARTVLEIVRRLGGLLDGALSYELDDLDHPPEAPRLELDSTAAERRLGWRPRWDLDEALARVAAWHEAHRRGEDMRRTSLGQIAAFH